MENIYKVGDFIIDFVCIYEITSIDQGLVYYRPVKGTDKVFTGTIPEKNLSKGGLRHLLTLKETESILNEFDVLSEDCVFDIRQIKEDLYSNVPLKLVTSLKCLYSSKNPLMKAEEEIKEKIINHLCLEISFVTDKSAFSVKQLIESKLLNKSI